MDYRKPEGCVIGVNTGISCSADAVNLTDFCEGCVQKRYVLETQLEPKENNRDINYLNPSISNVKANKDVRGYHVGTSDYSKHKIQPWDIWLEYGLNPWDADIIKRVLRTKEGEDRKLDYEKIKHICDERIRHIDAGIKLHHRSE